MGRTCAPVVLMLIVLLALLASVALAAPTARASATTSAATAATLMVKTTTTAMAFDVDIGAANYFKSMTAETRRAAEPASVAIVAATRATPSALDYTNMAETRTRTATRTTTLTAARLLFIEYEGSVATDNFPMEMTTAPAAMPAFALLTTRPEHRVGSEVAAAKLEDNIYTQMACGANIGTRLRC